MNVETRIRLMIGDLVVQNAAQAAQIEELTAKLASQAANGDDAGGGKTKGKGAAS